MAILKIKWANGDTEERKYEFEEWLVADLLQVRGHLSYRVEGLTDHLCLNPYCNVSIKDSDPKGGEKFCSLDCSNWKKNGMLNRLEESEIIEIKKALNKVGLVQQDAAIYLGVTSSKLCRKIKKYGLLKTVKRRKEVYDV